MVRTAVVLWLGALALTTSVLVLVVSVQQVTRWVRSLRPVGSVAEPSAGTSTGTSAGATDPANAGATAAPAAVSVPAQRVRPSAREQAAA